jgi:hypothetical protein
MRSTRTLRGKIRGTENFRRLIFDDGIIETGYRVTSFQAVPASGGNWSDASIILTTNVTGTTQINAEDNRQIGWIVFGANEGVVSMLDPDHVVVNDLYVYCGASFSIDYMVTVERVPLTENEAVIHMIKERSQDDLNRQP